MEDENVYEKADPLTPCCGAKTRSGQPCQRAPCVDRSRCHLHGGKSLRGFASPRFKHGLYSATWYGACVRGVAKEEARKRRSAAFLREMSDTEFDAMVQKVMRKAKRRGASI